MAMEKRECQCPVCYAPLGEVEFQKNETSGKNVVCQNCLAILWVPRNLQEAVFAPSDRTGKVFLSQAKV